MRNYTPDPRLYELLTILSPDVSEEDIPGQLDAIAGYITTAGGTVTETLRESPWGRRRLAYTIRHGGRDLRDGYYTVFHVSLDPDGVRDIERELKLNDQVIRYLITHYTPKPIVPGQQPEGAGAAPEAAAEAAPAETGEAAAAPATSDEAAVAPETAASTAAATEPTAEDAAPTEVAATIEPETETNAVAEPASETETETVDTAETAAEPAPEPVAVIEPDETEPAVEPEVVAAFEPDDATEASAATVDPAPVEAETSDTEAAAADTSDTPAEADAAPAEPTAPATDKDTEEA